ncbi:uncharacterized protein [Dysidea avara]|uniref:uncharacterized protein n=1 Tax=Dysidea avara TaxID=196820 RepID=UPI003322058E
MMRTILSCLIVCVTITGSLAIYPFQNSSLPFSDRVSDIVQRLNLQEKVAQMSHGGANNNGPAPAIKELGIKPYQWGTECLRGIVGAGTATSFPQALGLAATFNPDMIYEVAKATSIEVRAYNNHYVKNSDYQFHHGLSCWSPVINIVRDPRWGRNQETYGEDPYMSGVMAAEYVKGLQGDNDRYFRAIAGCKHFDAYAGPENIPTSRFSFNAIVSERDLQYTFYPAFEACVSAGTFSIMCSYNAVNGVPSCCNKELLTTQLRDTWKFEGYVISDQGAMECISDCHHYAKDWVHGAVAAATAGCDLEDGNMEKNTFATLQQAVNQHLIDESVLNTAVSRLFMARMRLGEFDPDEMNPYKSLSMDNVCSDEHKQLAINAAIQTFVLLKNANNLLPLRKNANIAIVGPFGKNVDLLTGDYPVKACDSTAKSPYDGIKEMSAGTVTCDAGCEKPSCDNINNGDQIKRNVQAADVAIVCVGLSSELESEGHDRSDISLPPNQLSIIQMVTSLNKPVVLVVFTAGPLDLSWAKDNVAAILQVFYPSAPTGDALARVVYGTASPAGRLPVTWPASLNNYPSMTDYSMNGRTYRYPSSNIPTLFPFGYGLSYTRFDYDSLVLAKSSISPCMSVTGRVTVKNVGNMTGDEVVQVYLNQTQMPDEPVPRLQLVNFTRVASIGVSQSVQVEFSITARQMATYKEKEFNPATWVIMPGQYNVFVGGQQPNQEISAPSNVLHTTFTIRGKPTKLDDCS